MVVFLKSRIWSLIYQEDDKDHIVLWLCLFYILHCMKRVALHWCDSKVIFHQIWGYWVEIFLQQMLFDMNQNTNLLQTDLTYPDPLSAIFILLHNYSQRLAVAASTLAVRCDLKLWEKYKNLWKLFGTGDHIWALSLSKRIRIDEVLNKSQSCT